VEQGRKAQVKESENQKSGAAKKHQKPVAAFDVSRVRKQRDT
jgi:hypothetical protein